MFQHYLRVALFVMLFFTAVELSACGEMRTTTSPGASLQQTATGVSVKSKQPSPNISQSYGLTSQKSVSDYKQLLRCCSGDKCYLGYHTQNVLFASPFGIFIPNDGPIGLASDAWAVYGFHMHDYEANEPPTPTNDRHDVVLKWKQEGSNWYWPEQSHLWVGLSRYETGPWEFHQVVSRNNYEYNHGIRGMRLPSFAPYIEQTNTLPNEPDMFVCVYVQYNSNDPLGQYQLRWTRLGPNVAPVWSGATDAERITATPNAGFAKPTLNVTLNALDSLNPDPVTDYATPGWQFRPDGASPWLPTQYISSLQYPYTSGTYTPGVRVVDDYVDYVMGFTYYSEVASCTVDAFPDPGEGNGGQGGWWMTGRDCSHNSCAEVAGPSNPIDQGNAKAVRWSYTVPPPPGLENQFPQASSGVIAANDSVYFNTSYSMNEINYSRVVSLNADGQLNWYWPLSLNDPYANCIMDCAPSINTDGSINIAVKDQLGGKLYKLNYDSALLNTEENVQSQIIDTTTDTAGAAYFGIGSSMSGFGLRALRSDNSRKWLIDYMFSPSTWTEYGPSIGMDESAYLSTSGGYLYAINSSGAEKWYQGPNAIDSITALCTMTGPMGEQAVILGGKLNYYYALHDYDGTQVWVFHVPTELPISANWSAPAVTKPLAYDVNGDGYNETIRVIYIVQRNPNTNSDVIYALDLETGSMLWTQATDGLTSYPITDVNGNLYISIGASLNSFTPHGEVRWTVSHSTPGYENVGISCTGGDGNKGALIGMFSNGDLLVRGQTTLSRIGDPIP